MIKPIREPILHRANEVFRFVDIYTNGYTNHVSGCNSSVTDRRNEIVLPAYKPYDGTWSTLLWVLLNIICLSLEAILSYAVVGTDDLILSLVMDSNSPRTQKAVISNKPETKRSGWPCPCLRDWSPHSKVVQTPELTWVKAAAGDKGALSGLASYNTHRTWSTRWVYVWCTFAF